MILSTDRAGDPALAARLRKDLRGEVLFDAFSRGRYSTDASIYQIEPVEATLRLAPGLDVRSFDATCCGMAGAFGYEVEHYEMSMKIGELAVLPTVRSVAADTLIVAGGTSCRHQIGDGTGRRAQHPARALDRASAAAT